MGTRSLIAVELDEGVVMAKYCHYDGYLSWNGVILNKFYNTKEKVKELFKINNSLISLKIKINDSKFHENDFYPMVFKDSKNFFENNPLEHLLLYGDIEYYYLFKNNKWYVKSYYDTNNEIKLLDDVFNNKEFLAFLNKKFIVAISDLDNKGVIPKDLIFNGVTPTTYILTPTGKVIGMPIEGAVDSNTLFGLLKGLEEYKRGQLGF